MSLRHRALQGLFRGSEILSALHAKAPHRRIDPASILVLTGYTPEISSYGDLAAENKARYAAKHGYAFRVVTDGFAPERPPAWSKILFIRRALASYSWVFWSDADALVMNDSVRIESFIEPGIDVGLTRASTPYPHVNTGNMLFGASAFSSLFLAAIWRLSVFMHDSTWEQRAVNYLIGHYRFRRLKICPNRAFNSLGEVPNDPDPYQAGDFIIHFPGLPNKAELMRRYNG